MKATLYKELSNEKTPVEIKAGQTAREALPDFDLENAIIVVNGKIRSPDYKLKENDIAMIRLTPAGWETVVIVVTALIAVGAGIVGGISLYNSAVAAEQAQKELDKMKKLTNKSDIDNRPFLRGASNTLATGNSQPYIIGRHFFTPYLLSKPFYQITGTDGANQYTYTALECGFNKQILQTVAIDDITIKKFDDSTPQEGAFNLDTGIFAEDGKIEIAQDGELLTALPALNYKTESTVCNDEIPYNSDVEAGTSEYLTYTLNPYAKDVDIAIIFPYGLYEFNDNGDKIETETVITPQYSLDGGSSWNSFTFNNNGSMTNRFKRNESTKELRFVAHRDFTAADYETVKENGESAIYIRVRNGGISGDSMIKNDCYVLYYQSVCFDPEKSTDEELVPCKIVEDRERAFCTILGLKLKASKINEDKLKKINIISHGIARTWNGTAWSAAKTATRNPAAWALEILTSPSHPASRYDDSEIDLESFGEFYEWCDDNDYKFDWTITQNTKKNDTLNYIMDAAGACMYYDITGRLAIAVDRPQENALAVYNPQNIISIQNKKTFGRRTDGLRVKYVNSKDDLFQEDTYLVMRGGQTLNQDSLIKDVTATGITTFEHIVKYARRLMAIEALRPKTTIIEAGNEGIFYTPFSKILIQDDSLKIGIGKGFTIREVKWWGGLLKKIYTNEPLTFDPAKTYGIIVNCFTSDGVKPVSIKVEGTGTTNELIVLSSFRASEDAKPEAGNIFSFGELDIDGEFTKITTEYIISQIKRSEKGFNLELVNYNEAIYDSGVIPKYKSNMTQKKTETGKTIPADTVTRAELSKEVAIAVGKIDPAGSGAAQEAANEVVHGIHFTNIHRIRDMELSLEEILAKIDSNAAEAAASRSMSEDEILIKVADTEAGLYSAIGLTKDEIMATVADTERELRAALDIQSSAVTAFVQGGGAEGQMSLSLELPVMIDAATRAKFVQAASEAEVSAVYAQLDGTSGENIRYAIKGNAGKEAVKTLWDKAIAAALIASQIVLSADQINIAGKTIFTKSAAEADAKTKADTAQKTGQDNVAKNLGYADYDDMVTKAAAGQTIIDGGYLRAELIEAEKILAKQLTIRNGGSLQSENYKADEAGWKISSDGSVEFTDGKFRGEINATRGTLQDVIVKGQLIANNTPFQPIASLTLSYNTSYGGLVVETKINISSVERVEKGVYKCNLSTPVIVKGHTDSVSGDGKVYIDIFAIGNAHDTFDKGYANPLHISINWVRESINNKLAYTVKRISEFTIEIDVELTYFTLYFPDNNSDQLIDPLTAQIFLFACSYQGSLPDG